MLKEIIQSLIKKFPNLLSKIFIYFRLLALFLGKIFLRLEIKGLENIDKLKPGGILFIANHHSYWDPFLIGSVLPKDYLKKITRLRFMTAEEFINKKWYGPLIRFVGAYPIYKTKGDYVASLSDTINLLKNNQDVLIFPSGGIEKEFNPKNAKPGVAYLAKNLDLQIVPISIKDTYKISIKDFLSRRRRVVIKFGEKLNINKIINNTSTYREQAMEISRKIGELN